MPRQTSPSDRVQLRSQQELREPGSCALCGSGNCDDGYVDTGVWIEFHGNVYFCTICTNQIIGVVRALTAEEAQELINASNTVAAENKELLKEVESLREYQSNVNSLLAGFTGNIDSSNLTAVTDPNQGQLVLDEPNGGSASGESTAKESGKGRRPVQPKPAESSNGSESPQFDL